MIKGIAIVTKRTGIGDGGFHRYWREVHGLLPPRVNTVRRYVQYYRTTHALAGFENCPYRGVRGMSASTTSRPCSTCRTTSITSTARKRTSRTSSSPPAARPF